MLSYITFPAILIPYMRMEIAYSLNIFIGMTKAELDKEMEKLFAVSENSSGKVCTSMQIKDRTIPVQMYFKYSLKENRSYIS